MLKDTLFDMLSIAASSTGPLLSSVYFFHDIRITCHTNSPLVQAMLTTMLSIFPEPEKMQGTVNYFVLCYSDTSQFPVPLPRQRVRTDTMRLLTNTKLKSYRSSDTMTQYQRYEAVPSVNEEALSVITPDAGIALTQIGMPEHYQPAFLRRYVFLLALGQLLHPYGFEPCHAAAVTAPYNRQQGALIIGSSGSGKTTLSLGCAINGCGLLGDDLVMLRNHMATGKVGAYAIACEVAVRSASIDLWPSLSFLYKRPADERNKRYCTIEQIRHGAARTQTGIRLLLFPFLTTEAKSTVTPLSKASTLQELVDKCLDRKQIAMQAQASLFVLLSRLAEQAPGYRLALARGANDGPQLVCSLFADNAL